MQHYIGFTQCDLDPRLENHRQGRASAITKAAVDQGIGFTLARAWSGTPKLKREIKGRHGAGLSLAPSSTSMPCFARRSATHWSLARSCRPTQWSVPSFPAKPVPCRPGVDSCQLRAFLNTAQEHRLFAFYHLAAYTGARRGELLNLRWGDIDLEDGQVRITGSAAVIAGQHRGNDQGRPVP